MLFRVLLGNILFLIRKKEYHGGFTLVELSVVIVMIGLIISGVVGAQSLIKQSKLRNIISDYEAYKTAAHTFKLEYDALPGDLTRASSYGIGDNGNGDRFIHVRFSEIGNAWQHLKNAGLVPGVWLAGQRYFPGNSPPTAFGPDVYPVFTSVPRGNGSANNNNCIMTWGSALYGIHSSLNLIAFGRVSSDPGQGYDCPMDPFLTVSEASGLDNKTDDGRPSTGILFVSNQSASNNDGNRCVDNWIRAGGENVNYDFGEQGETCRLIFKLGL